MIQIEARSAKDAFDELLCQVNQPLDGQPRDVIFESLGATVVINDPGLMLIESSARKFNYRSQISECLWNCANTDRINFPLRYVSTMGNYVQNQEDGDRGRATWAYGKYINKQFMDAALELQCDPSSRRARISIQYDGARGTPPCLTSIQWLIREGGLVQITNMRSNDIWRGFPLDVVQFGLMGHIMASFLGLSLIQYIHQIGSVHLYTNDNPDAIAYLRGTAYGRRLPQVNRYALGTAIRGDVLRFIERVGHKEDMRPGMHLDYSQVRGLEPYAALLAGDYTQLAGGVYWDLKKSGHGIGW